MKKIIAITCEGDLHTKSVAAKIESHGHQLIPLEREKYGIDWTITARISKGRTQVFIQTTSEMIDEANIGSVWNRRDFTVESTKKSESPTDQYIATQQSIHVNGTFRLLETLVPFWINKPSANHRANSKLFQAWMAKKHGLQIPSSFFGGSPTVADQFLNSIDSNTRLSIKPLESIHLRADDGNVYAHYNSIFRRRGIEELSSLSSCPVILQEFIEKKYEVRATLVGHDIYAASIDTGGASEDAKTDWRHYDWANTPYKSISLSQEVANQLRSIAGELDLRFAAFDLIQSKTGDCVF